MDPTFSSAPTPHCTARGVVSRAVLVVSCLGLTASLTHAQDQLDVGVRSTVVDKHFGKAKSQLQNAKPHGKIYGILSVQQIKGEQKLLRPVDEAAIMEVLSSELNSHGYHLFAPAQKPEIVLTVFYGRGFLSNPYQVEGGRTETQDSVSAVNGSGGESLGGPTVSITGTPNQLFKEKTPGFEQKLQKAGYEKLYIRVSAWLYPTNPKAKAKQLWNTTMVVDDPDHRDLNAVAAKMLEAGVAYFDHDMTEEEVDVYKPLPEGHVKVGPAEVVPTTPTSH